MIILSEDSPIKLATSSTNPRGESTPPSQSDVDLESPPPYASRGTPQVGTYGTLERPALIRRKRRRRRCARIIQVVLIVVFTLDIMVAAVFYFGNKDLLEYFPVHPEPTQEQPPRDDGVPEHTPPPPPDGDPKRSDDVSTCLQNSTWSPTSLYHVDVGRIDFPVSADLLYLVSNGDVGSGVVQILKSSEEEDVVRMSVLARYSNRADLNKITLCSLERAPGQLGVGIFASEDGSSLLDRLTWDVTIVLPQVPDHTLPFNFESIMPRFSHAIQTDSLFGSVHVQTDMWVTAEELHAEDIFIETSGAPILGEYSASSSLRLSTVDHEIQADVNLVATDGHSPTLEMKTSNARIDTTIRLMNEGTLPANFTVSALAPNSYLNMTINSDGPGADLHLDASSTNKLATVCLPRRYEGNFALTSHTPATSPPHFFPVHNRDTPKGSRVIQMTTFEYDAENSVHLQQGDVSWTPSHRVSNRRGKGTVNITTTGAPSFLML